MSERPFTKMHGLGNDFVIVDARADAFDLGPARARAVADRRRGVGCDQILVVEPARNGGADAFMRIVNADGGEAEACGNGTRCVAHLMMAETGRAEAAIETRAGVLRAWSADGGGVAVDMGPVATGWRDIPLAEETDTLHLPLSAGPLADGVAVNVGNPHAVFFVADAEAVDLAGIGPGLETHALFPERANIEAAEIGADGTIRLRVWERGAGITQACGSGACAALVAASRRGLVGRSAVVRLDGGDLAIEWLDDDHVVMTGPVSASFTGALDAAALAAGGAP